MDLPPRCMNLTDDRRRCQAEREGKKIDIEAMQITDAGCYYQPHFECGSNLPDLAQQAEIKRRDYRLIGSF